MLRAFLFMLAVGPLFGQTAAGMLARLTGVRWEAAPAADCVQHSASRIDVYATEQWTHHCTDTRDGVVRESFFYVFGEPARAARLRVDARSADESPETTALLLPALRRALTARFGPPTHEPELVEIGFRHLRYGEPVAGDHWKSGGLHYFLHANQANLSPMGMRRGVQLTVMNNRLAGERAQDARLVRAEEFGDPSPEIDQRLHSRLTEVIGAPYVRAMQAGLTASSPGRARRVRETIQDLTAILREVDRPDAPSRALYLLAADAVVQKLSLWLETPSPVQRLLSRHGVKLGLSNSGGLGYERELLWRAWREPPETEGGELAFLELQRRGWNTGSGEGCPKNPDLFREVIAKGETFLASHPQTGFRKEVLSALAVANESWWSIARSPAEDPIVGGQPYPRRAVNRRQAGQARREAIRYYREVVRVAPGATEAASALRRLPRLELGLDTGQRRFFCSYC